MPHTIPMINELIENENIDGLLDKSENGPLNTLTPFLKSLYAGIDPDEELNTLKNLLSLFIKHPDKLMELLSKPAMKLESFAFFFPQALPALLQAIQTLSAPMQKTLLHINPFNKEKQTELLKRAFEYDLALAGTLHQTIGGLTNNKSRLPFMYEPEKIKQCIADGDSTGLLTIDVTGHTALYYAINYNQTEGRPEADKIDLESLMAVCSDQPLTLMNLVLPGTKKPPLDIIAQQAIMNAIIHCAIEQSYAIEHSPKEKPWPCFILSRMATRTGATFEKPAELSLAVLYNSSEQPEFDEGKLQIALHTLTIYAQSMCFGRENIDHRATKHALTLLAQLPNRNGISDEKIREISDQIIDLVFSINGLNTFHYVVQHADGIQIAWQFIVYELQHTQKALEHIFEAALLVCQRQEGNHKSIALLVQMADHFYLEKGVERKYKEGALLRPLSIAPPTYARQAEWADPIIQLIKRHYPQRAHLSDETRHRIQNLLATTLFTPKTRDIETERYFKAAYDKEVAALAAPLPSKGRILALNRLTLLRLLRKFPTPALIKNIETLAKTILTCTETRRNQLISQLTCFLYTNGLPWKLTVRIRQAHHIKSCITLTEKLKSCTADVDFSDEEYKTLIDNVKQCADLRQATLIQVIASRTDLTADQKHWLIFHLIYQLYHQGPECRSLLNAHGAILALLQTPIDHRFVIHLLVEFQQYFQQPVTPVISALFSVVADAKIPLNPQQQEAILMLTKTAIESGEDLTERNGKGDTILHAICRKTNNINFVYELVKQGVPNTANDRGRYPCQIANDCGNNEIACLLNLRFHDGKCKLETVVQARPVKPVTDSFVKGVLVTVKHRDAPPPAYSEIKRSSDDLPPAYTPLVTN